MSTASIVFSRARAALPPLRLLAALLAPLKRVARTSTPARAAVQKLGAGANVWIIRPLGRTITCEDGTLWLTFDNEPHDVILEAGQSHRCVKASKLLIHALADARVCVA